MKLTEWFPGDVKPVRRGVYRRHFGRGIVGFSMWDGIRWMCAQRSVKSAYEEKFASPTTNLKWRGLAEKP